MSVINTNQFATGFAPASTLADFENAPGTASAEYAAGFPQPSDNIQYEPRAPISLPIQSPVFAENGYEPSTSSGTANGGYDFNSILNQIGNLISGLFQQLGSMLGGSTLGGTSNGNGSATPQGSPNAAPETYFTGATATSTGDPHLGFNGITGDGATLNDKWDSMNSHADLLCSNSFAGGYRVSTQVTAPNADGATHNASATVTTDGGATAVTMQKSGAYSVTQNGQSVQLTQGQAASLGNGETVTLNSDGSLTVDDANANGGSIWTTLKSNGSGVDVTNDAKKIDLGGYLVHKSDSDVDPTATPGFGALPSYGVPASIESPVSMSAAMPYGETAFEALPQFEGQPMVTGLEQFDPDAAATSLQNIEYA